MNVISSCDGDGIGDDGNNGEILCSCAFIVFHEWEISAAVGPTFHYDALNGI